MNNQKITPAYARIHDCLGVLEALAKGCCVDERRSTIKALAVDMRLYLDNRAEAVGERDFEADVEQLSE